MNYLNGSIFNDLIYIICCIILIRIYFIQKVICSQKEHYLVLNVPPFIYTPLVGIHIASMMYVVGADIGGWNDQYIKIANTVIIIALFIEIMIAIYNRVKYGPKDQKFKNDIETGIISIIFITIIMAAMYLGS